MRIAVYGATGYTGKLVAAEVHRRGFELVMSGRNGEKLGAVVDALELTGAQVRPAAVDDPAALAAAFDRCAGVINCAGPFTFFGEPVVRAAIVAGCHYVDTTGEQGYVQRLFERCGADAERAGRAVVPAMGFDIVPGDLIAHLTAVSVEPLERLTIGYSTDGFGMTRGTMHSALEIVGGGDLRFEGGRWLPAGPLRRTPALMFPGRRAPSPTMRFPGCEIVTVPRHVKTQQVEVVMDANSFVPGPMGKAVPSLAPMLGSMLRTPARRMIDRMIDRLPEGPKEAKRRAATFTVVAEATGTDGRVARGEIHGSDIYGTTAVLCTEGIRRLCEGEPPAGVLAPAQAFDVADFMSFLETVGYRWKVSEPGR